MFTIDYSQVSHIGIPYVHAIFGTVRIYTVVCFEGMQHKSHVKVNCYSNPTFQLQGTAQQGSERYSGVVKKSCNNEKTFFTASNKYFTKRFNITRFILYIGGIMQTVLVWIAIVFALRTNSNVLQRSHFYTFQYYGQMCGITCCSFLATPMMMYCSFSTLDLITPQRGSDIVYYSVGISMLCLPLVAGSFISFFFVYKTKPPAIPYILHIPITLLCCCCNKRHGKTFSYMLALWINVIAIQYASFHATLMMFCILAEPFAVIANALVLVLGIFCLANIFAVLFTISASLCTRKCRGTTTERARLFQAIVLIPLLAMVSCYCACLTSATYSFNPYPLHGNAQSFVGSVAFPLFLAIVTVSLKTLITKWLVLGTNHEGQATSNTDEPLETVVIDMSTSKDEEPLNA